MEFNDSEINSLDSDHSLNSAWRIWYQFGPMSYDGQTKYFRTFHNFGGNLVCYDGYLGARNLLGGNFIYEGWLYRCDDVRPIPSSVKKGVILDEY